MQFRSTIIQGEREGPFVMPIWRVYNGDKHV